MKIDVLVMNNKPHKLDDVEHYIHGSILEVDDHSEEGKRDHWKIVEDCKYKGRLILKTNCLVLPENYDMQSIGQYRLYIESVKVLKNTFLNLIKIGEPVDIQKASIVSALLQGNKDLTLKQAIKDANEALSKKEEEVEADG